MCGHLGIISTKKLDDKLTEAYATMMNLSVPRGKDSAGTLAIERKKDGLYFAVRKKAQHPWDYLRDTATKNFLSSTNHALLGHVRWATIGGVTEGTAHPFHVRPKEKDHEEVIGFHNGTIRGYKEHSDLSDSDRFYKRVSEIGFREALEELPKDSAYAFVMFSVSKGDFTFFRNDRRELFMAASKDSSTLIYASEKRFITSALAYAEKLDEFEAPGMLPRNSLLKVKYSGEKLKLSVINDFLPEETMKKHEEATAVRSGGFYSCEYGTLSEWRGGVSSSGGTARTSTAITPPPRMNPKTVKGGKVQGPFPSIRYKFEPVSGKLHREIYRTATNSQSVTYWPGSSQYAHELEQMKKYCSLERGGCWIELDEETYDFVVSLPGGKVKKITTKDQRWDGWFNTMEFIGNLWAEVIDEDKRLKKTEVTMNNLLFNFNQLHSMASRLSTAPSSKGEKDEVKEAKEIEAKKEEFDDPIPFDGEDISYLGYRYDEWDLDTANHKLSAGCQNCLEHSTVNDLVYWVSDRHYVCEPCAEMVAVNLGADMMNSTIGRLKSNNILAKLN